MAKAGREMDDMSERKRILIADASEEFRQMLADMLTEESDMTLVGQTGDGEELLDLIARTAPDVVVMELLLTGMDGLEVLEKMGERKPKVLVLSAFGNANLAEEVSSRGAAYCMLKPCRMTALMERIRLLAEDHVQEEEDDGSALGIPFYTFYKEIGTSQNGNKVYAKTYVSAIPLLGYDEYLESQKAYHRR